MSDPKRWSEDAEAGELERELLGAGQAVRLPESERRALWAGIALALPAAVPPVVPGKALATSGLTGLLTKAVIFLVAAGGLSVGVAHLWSTPRAREPAKKALLETTPVAPTPTPTPASTLSATAEGAPVEAAPATVPIEKAHAASESQLREESAAVLEARARLRSGDAAQSLVLLEQARLRFPRGGLGQEREALTIQALAQSGQSAAARRRGQAFLRAHPSSPYAADVRRITED